jgi:hypothetical protein
MPTEWRVALICHIHKKDNIMECASYHGIVLLEVVYKVSSKTTDRRLETYMKEVVAYYQVSFRRNRSTTDLIFDMVYTRSDTKITRLTL